MARLLTTVAPLALRFIGRFMARHPLATLGAVEYETNGAVTRNLIEPLAERVIGGATGGKVEELKGFSQSAFNALADGLKENGLYAAIPLMAGIGMMSGGGIVDKFLDAAVLGGIAYLGVKMAESAGIKTPGLSMNFGAASLPKPSVTVPPPAPQPTLRNPVPQPLGPWLAYP